MESMFKGNASFNNGGDSWNVSNVKNMKKMFNNATSFNQDIGGWNVSKVTTISNMFDNAQSFDQDLRFWPVGDVSSASEYGLNSGHSDSTYFSSSSLTYFYAKGRPFSDTDLEHAVESWFSDSTAAENIYGDISDWNTSEVTDMEKLFHDKIFNEDISDWDVSKVTTIRKMFKGSTFNRNIKDWNLANVDRTGGLDEYGNESYHSDPLFTSSDKTYFEGTSWGDLVNEGGLNWPRYLRGSYNTYAEYYNADPNSRKYYEIGPTTRTQNWLNYTQIKDIFVDYSGLNNPSGTIACIIPSFQGADVSDLWDNERGRLLWLIGKNGNDGGENTCMALFLRGRNKSPFGQYSKISLVIGEDEVFWDGNGGNSWDLRVYGTTDSDLYPTNHWYIAISWQNNGSNTTVDCAFASWNNSTGTFYDPTLGEGLVWNRAKVKKPFESPDYMHVGGWSGSSDRNWLRPDIYVLAKRGYSQR